MNKKIAIIKGDGIGPEIINEAVKVLDKIADKYRHNFCYTEALLGISAYRETKTPLPNETIEICTQSDSVLLGAVGGIVGDAEIDSLPGHLRPEAGLLELRKAMNVFANLRPSVLFKPLMSACPLKESITQNGLDLIIVRELLSGAYFGKRGRFVNKQGEQTAYDTMIYSENEIERIVRVGFEIASKRRKKLCSVDKANVLDSSRLWREIAEKTAKDYPDVEYCNMLVDNCAMQLIRNPGQFDVIVTENTFGDILSDEASMLTGSIGMIPSASLNYKYNMSVHQPATGEHTHENINNDFVQTQGMGMNNKQNENVQTQGMGMGIGLYEPIHGSAPDIAGMDKANPIAAILSAAMMLKYSFGAEKESEDIENAVLSVLEQGYRTHDIIDYIPSVHTHETHDIIDYIPSVHTHETEDIMDKNGILVGCKKMGDLICEALV